MDYNEYLMNTYINEFAPMSAQETFHSFVRMLGTGGIVTEYLAQIAEWYGAHWVVSALTYAKYYYETEIWATNVQVNLLAPWKQELTDMGLGFLGNFLQ